MIGLPDAFHGRRISAFNDTIYPPLFLCAFSLFYLKTTAFFFISSRTNRSTAHRDLFAGTREVSNARSIPPYSGFRVTRPASCVAETHTSRASTFPIFTTSRRARVWASLYRERGTSSLWVWALTMLLIPATQTQAHGIGFSPCF